MEGFEKEQEINQAGCLETLRDRIYELKKESQDHYFTEYLLNLQDRVIKEKHTVDLLSDELERKYKFYLERLEKVQNGETEQETENGTAQVPQEETNTILENAISVVENAPGKTVYRGASTELKSKHDSEFKVGIVAFSIVGVLFLLVSFAMLGEYFMNGFAKGMCLYAIAAVVCIFSVAFVRRWSVKFSQVLNMLGIAGLHVATYINTYILGNMNFNLGIVIVVLTTLGVLGIDARTRKKEWKLDGISAGAYYLFVAATYVMVVHEECGMWMITITLSVLLLLTKLVARNRHLYPLDTILTVVTAVTALDGNGESYGYVLLAVVLLSTVLVRFWHMFYQCVITGTTILFLAISLKSEIVLTLIVAVLWLFMLLFNHVKALRGENIKCYNYTVTVGMVIAYMTLAGTDYEEYRILYFILAFLGVGFIYFMCQERYGLPEKARGLSIAVLLSYITLIANFTYPITSSIILMLIGLVCIGSGFVLSDKKIRIYGLVQSLIVCFKITLSDFAGGDELQRMILFFVAGVVALLISGIYIILEKKYIKD